MNSIQRLLILPFIVFIILAKCTVSYSLSNENIKKNSIKISLLWKANASLNPIRVYYANPWSGLYRIGFGIEISHSISNRIDGGISIDYIDNKDQRKDYILQSPDQKYVGIRKTYRLIKIKADILYARGAETIKLYVGGGLAISKASYSFSTEPNNQDIDVNLRGYDIPLGLETKLGAEYYIPKGIYLDLLFVEIAYNLFLVRISNSMYEYSHRERSGKIPPTKSLSAGLFLKAGLGKYF